MCWELHGHGSTRIYTMSESRRTISSPTTEINVSITDQVLIVSPIVMPKYSLTSQKPASLTCEKNSEPAPTANTTSARCVGDKFDASGATMPDAVIVAT